MKTTKKHILVTAFTLTFLSLTLPLFATNYLLIHKDPTTKNIKFNQGPASGEFTVIVDGVAEETTYSSIGPIIVDGSGTVNIEFNTTEPVPLYRVSTSNYDGYFMHGYMFWVLQGTLNLSLGDSYTSTATLINTNNGSESSFAGNVFRVSGRTSGGTNCKLTIKGNANHRFVVDGCAQLDVTGNNSDGYGATNDGLTTQGALIAVYGGTYTYKYPYSTGATFSQTITSHGGSVELEYVNLTNNWNNYYPTSSTDPNVTLSKTVLPTGSGGAVQLITSSSSVINLTMSHCNIENCYAANSGAAMDISGAFNATASTLMMENCVTANCFTASSDATSHGGTYRTHEGPNFDITMENCDIHDNKTDRWGGAITYNLTSHPLKLTECTIYNNYGEAGGLYCLASTEVNDCTITGNYAKTNGGGIYMGGTGENGNGEVTLSGMVIVDNNQIVGSSTENNVYVGQTNWRVVYIGEAGLECGSSIGISNRAHRNFFGQCKGSTAVATLNGSNAYRNHYFFDDNGVCVPINSADPYPTYPSAPYYDGYGGYLWFWDKSDIASDSDSWHDQSATAGTDYVLTDGYVSEVKTAAGLAYFSKDVLTHDYTGKTVTLSNDISLAGHNWEPIGFKEGCGTETDWHPFTGTFDGQGHTISDMNCPFQYFNVGLFGYVKGGTLKNIIVGGTVDATVNTNAGGIVGLMDGGSIYNCYSFVELSGKSGSALGGLVGKIANGSLENSFANPIFTVTDGTPNVGGLVADNYGRIENCYVRLERTQTLGTAHFGMLAGSNTGTENIVSCYAPNGVSTQFNHPYAYLYDNATTGLKDCDLYNKVIAPYLYSHSNDNTLVSDNSKNLLGELNRWVEAPAHSSGGYSPWKRTTAGGYSYTYDDGRGDVTVTGGNINDDYPIHKMVGLSCAASPDGLTIEYKKSLDDMITKYNGLRGGGTIWLYDSPKEDDGSDELVSETNNDDVLLYIDEDASLLQSSSANNTLTAYTGQTLKTYSTANGNRWHLFSSPLKQSQIGISYTNDGKVDFSWASDPCGVIFSKDDDNALFPHDIPVASMDLYSFYEPEYHWINFRRNSLSHWHENAHDVQINYNGNGINIGVEPYTSDNGYSNDGNEPILVPGKGYLVSIKQEQLVQNKGVLNNGNVTLQNVTKTNFNAWAGLLGFNLLGNPYQSYLDFEKFINDGNGTNNGTNLWEGTSEYNNTYATYDPSQKAYVQYKSGASGESNTASQYIHPHQGFFIRMTKGDADANSTTVTYTNNMRVGELPTGATSPFRSDEIGVAFPLINFLVRDSESNGDVAVLELGRTNEEGALKMRLGECTGRISLGYEGDDYGILFRNEVEDYQSLRFEATEAGTFTLTWNTANAEFDKLTLIDNIAGTTTDMLARDTYCFEATPDQYPSRFKVVIGDYKGIDEPEPAEGPAESFAFQMGDQLVVNGEGNLQVVDMLGRVVMTERLTSSQNMVGLPKSAGVYVLRLTDGGGTRTQKIVVGL